SRPLFLSTLPRPPRPTLFPYTTLFRSPLREGRRGRVSNGGFVGSCPRRLRRGMYILPVCLRLLAPAAELHISPNHDLQCGIDDVIRRALDEGRVLLDGDRNRFLQFVFALHHLGRLINDRHDFSFLISSWPYWTRAKHMVNRAFPCSLGWSDRHGSRGNEVGSPPAHSGGLPASKLNVAPCATFMLPTTSPP